jgi:hypothetical protein
MLQRGACVGRHLGHDCVNRVLKRCRAQGPAEHKAGTSCACARDTSWQGPSPLPRRYAAPCPAGGQSPRPAPALPLAGALHPPGRALASAGPGPAGQRGTVPRGRGKLGSRFRVPPALKKAPSPLQWQGQSPLPQRQAAALPSRGPKAPGQRPPRPRRALRPRRVRRWPLCLPDLPVHRAPSRAGGGNAVRFLAPPEQSKALPPHLWQGPSPLPQRKAGIRTGRGPKAPSQRPPRPWRALCRSRTCRSTGHRPTRAGKRAAFLDREDRSGP